MKYLHQLILKKIYSSYLLEKQKFLILLKNYLYIFLKLLLIFNARRFAINTLLSMTRKKKKKWKGRA